MAKGVEDTAFYRWTHLVSLCEVGGDPARFGIDPDELHAWAAHTVATWPATMTAGTTHDTKRGEDVRARIDVLSELAPEWVSLVRTLREATAELRPTDLDGRTENLLWQTLAGTWTAAGPIPADRLQGYLLKAAREQKSWTTWTAPDTAREEAMLAYAAALLEHPDVVEALHGVGGAHGGGGARRGAEHQAAPAHRARRRGRLPGQRGHPDLPRRPGQPPPGRPRRPRRAAWARWTPAPGPAGWTTRSSSSPPPCCGCAGATRRPSSAPTPGTSRCRPPPATPSRWPAPRPRARASSRWPPGWRAARPPPAACRTPPSSCPRAPGATSSTTPPCPAGPSRLGDLLAARPVALLERI